MPRCALITQMTHKVYGANEHFLGSEMTAERLMMLSRCVALRACLGCDWDGDVLKDMNKLVLPVDTGRTRVIDDLVGSFNAL